MKKLYEKSELTFALVWIAVYCVLQSLANPLNKAIGVAYAASSAFCVLQKAEPQSTVAEQNLRSIPDFWGRAAKDGTFPILFSHMTEPQALLGICWAEAPQSTDFSYGIGAVCAPDCVAPADFSLRSVPARTWAVFPCRGAMPDAIQQLWQRIGSEFFPTSGYRPTGELDIEVYPEGDMHAPDYASEIWVPVEKV